MSNAGPSWSPSSSSTKLRWTTGKDNLPGSRIILSVVAGPEAARLCDFYVAVRFRMIHFRALRGIPWAEINIQTVRLQGGAFRHHAYIPMVTSAPALIEILQKVRVDSHRARLSGRMSGRPRPD